MTKTDLYREKLREIDDWEPFLLRESGLPGPRGNLELAQVVADEGDEAMFERLLAHDAQRAPTNSPQEFLAFCGVVGLGRLVAEGHREHLAALRRHASDPRWRTREAVAMALQRLGDADMEALLHQMEAWSLGNPLEQRAAAAALCEPRLLQDKEQTAQVLRILDKITASIPQIEDRKSEEFQALRKGLGYCWSVAVVALPEAGKAAMERWLASDDHDVRWIMKENLKKKRLARMDAAWVARWQAEVAQRKE
jgi:3-methyladenine DNA glycosylase AlkC